jgi:hypothetical protein
MEDGETRTFYVNEGTDGRIVKVMGYRFDWIGPWTQPPQAAPLRVSVPHPSGDGTRTAWEGGVLPSTGSMDVCSDDEDNMPLSQRSDIRAMILAQSAAPPVDSKKPPDTSTSPPNLAMSAPAPAIESVFRTV